MSKNPKFLNFILALILIVGVFVISRIFFIAASKQYEGTTWGIFNTGRTPIYGWERFDKKFRLDEVGDYPLPVAMIYNQSKNNVILYLDRPAEQDEIQKIRNYFITTLRIPKKDVWVNLMFNDSRVSPYDLASSPVGADLLAIDFLLKGISAHYKSQKEYTNEISKFYEKIYGQSDMEPWYGLRTTIYGDEIMLVSFNDTVRIDKATLKTEQAIIDTTITKHRLYDKLKDDYLYLYSKYVAPKVKKQINENLSFSNLRQIYRCFILANWLKCEYPITSINAKLSFDIEKNLSISLDIKNRYQDFYKLYFFLGERTSKNKYGQSRVEHTYYNGGVEFAKMAQIQPKKLTDDENQKSPVITQELRSSGNEIVINLSEPATEDGGNHLWTRYSDGKSARGRFFINGRDVKPEATGGIELQ